MNMHRTVSAVKGLNIGLSQVPCTINLAQAPLEIQSLRDGPIDNALIKDYRINKTFLSCGDNSVKRICQVIEQQSQVFTHIITHLMKLHIAML